MHTIFIPITSILCACHVNTFNVARKVEWAVYSHQSDADLRLNDCTKERRRSSIDVTKVKTVGRETSCEQEYRTYLCIIYFLSTKRHYLCL